MEKLEAFFYDIKRIADSMEKIVADNESANRCVNGTSKECEEVMESEERSNTMNGIVNNVINEAATNMGEYKQSQTSNNLAPTTVIPVTNVQHTYTMDELSLAMARALDMGMMTEIQNLMAQFNVSCLAELNPSFYNDLALKLREIGVEV